MATLAVVVASPIILETIYAPDRDYSVAGDVGQAYGGASAVVGAIALLVVAASVLLQYRQHGAQRAESLGRFNEELVALAMENPKYRQCWGARVSPQDVDEDLFYYCSKLIKMWTQAWELHRIDERQAREYLKNFFDSEIPRLFWESHGDWHRRGAARSPADRFRELVNEEFLLAKKGGAPSRAYEVFPPAGAELSGPRTTIEQ
ncbi:DUF6082 family protein [Actinoplanes sp. NPDC051411]|uniref:DUF6082 family protein n=1 Tax=Actinoplanes sp. NPDC051411 TaxID=3155522 RepID=UPI003412E4C9